jgi:hypothetical protein
VLLFVEAQDELPGVEPYGYEQDNSRSQSFCRFDKALTLVQLRNGDLVGNVVDVTQERQNRANDPEFSLVDRVV